MQDLLAMCSCHTTRSKFIECKGHVSQIKSAIGHLFHFVGKKSERRCETNTQKLEKWPWDYNANNATRLNRS